MGFSLEKMGGDGLLERSLFYSFEFMAFPKT